MESKPRRKTGSNRLFFSASAWNDFRAEKSLKERSFSFSKFTRHDELNTLIPQSWLKIYALEQLSYDTQPARTFDFEEKN